MLASQVRTKFLAFMARQGHAIIPAAPIIPPDDPTTLFTSSGMQQMVPYLKGEPHPMGKRIADSQPSFRAGDIEEVGDNRHTTCFEMLGNWSLGDYFKKEQLAWVWEFMTGELWLLKEKLHVTIFAGNGEAERDNEAAEIWQSLGVSKEHIHAYDAKKNWWSRAGTPEEMPEGEIGGPDSEIFFDFGAERMIHENSPWASEPCHVNCDCGRFLEIGNSVFMQFVKQGGKLTPLPSQNVDFGGGLERLTAAVQDTPDIFMTDVFSPIISRVELSSGKKYNDNAPAMRVIADHLRAATLMIAQGIEPSNKLQGYILRRLLRRAAVRTRKLGVSAQTIFTQSVPEVITFYADAGFIEKEKEKAVLETIANELVKFEKALEKGIKEIERTTKMDEQKAFDLYQSLGFPWEITNELCQEKGIKLDHSKFEEIFAQHKASSKTASAGMFKGGLADQSEITTRYHTATHLLHQALYDVLGSTVAQAGSNITSERLRFDYTYAGKPTTEQLEKIEKIVNEKIVADLTVVKTIEDKKEALNSGAKAFFAEKYPEKVSVYTIGDYSRELCGGPHVGRTGEIGKVKIIKDEALGSGKRRIYVAKSE